MDRLYLAHADLCKAHEFRCAPLLVRLPLTIAIDHLEGHRIGSRKYLCDTVQVVGFVMLVRGVATKLFITSHLVCCTTCTLCCPNAQRPPHVNET